MKTNRKIKQVAAYILFPILFVGIGTGIYYLGVKPVQEIIQAKGELAIIKGGPDYGNQYNEDLIELESQSANQDGTDGISSDKIDVPAVGTWYGKVICNEISLDVPLYYGDTEEILKKGVGQYTGSGLPGGGKPILIGGHDATFFQPLEQISEGSLIKIVTNNGINEYKVTDTKIYNQNDKRAYNLKKEAEQLILYTCYPFGAVTGTTQQRFFVYAEKEGQ